MQLKKKNAFQRAKIAAEVRYARGRVQRAIVSSFGPQRSGGFVDVVTDSRAHGQLLETERTYLDGLNALLNVYLEPMLKQVRAGHTDAESRGADRG